jgi:predicted acetyltransferase
MPGEEELRSLDSGDLEQAWALDHHAFHTPIERRERFLRLDPARIVGAFLGTRLVGIAASYPMRQCFGGRAVPMGGVHSVAVAPERRGRGLAKRMLVHLLAGMRERGEALSTLFPATARPYRAVGYELAGTMCWRRVAPRALERLPRPEHAQVHPLAPDEIPLLAECHAELAGATNGFVLRSAAAWEALRDELWAGRSVFAVRGRGGRITGYVVYRQLGGAYSSLGGPFQLVLDEVLWSERDAGLALWGMLASWGPQVESILYRGSAEDPLLWLLPEQEIGLEAELRWMTRLVDPVAAVLARGFAAEIDAEAQLALADPVLPANEGRYVLRVGKGRGEHARGGRGELRIDAGAFASLFTGYATPDALARGGGRSGAPGPSRAARAAAVAGPPPGLPHQLLAATYQIGVV